MDERFKRPPENDSEIPIDITEPSVPEPGRNERAQEIRVDLARTLPRVPGTSRDPMIGSILAERYKIIELIGT